MLSVFEKLFVKCIIAYPPRSHKHAAPARSREQGAFLCNKLSWRY